MLRTSFFHGLGVALGCSLAFSASLVRAEADGPDFWTVTDVREDDVLNIREEPDPHSKKIGEIPPDGTCIKNLGCVGGLTLEEFTTLTDEEREEIKRQRPRWCRIEYQKTVGWVAGRYLKEGVCDQPSEAPHD